MNCLIIGGNSQIASHMRRLYSQPHITFFSTYRDKRFCTDKYSFWLDLELVHCYERELKSFIASNNISTALISAGITSQDACESDPAYTELINVKAVKRIFDILFSSNVFIVLFIVILLLKSTISY